MNSLLNQRSARNRLQKGRGNRMMDIYYVEDDEIISQAVKEFLGQQGYRVSVFPTVSGAKEALGHTRPTLVLVDWNMPDGNGNLFVRWIRSQWKELPVIFLTVRGDSRDIVSGFENGADDYVVKPFEKTAGRNLGQQREFRE